LAAKRRKRGKKDRVTVQHRPGERQQAGAERRAVGHRHQFAQREIAQASAAEACCGTDRLPVAAPKGGEQVEGADADSKPIQWIERNRQRTDGAPNASKVLNEVNGANLPSVHATLPSIPAEARPSLEKAAASRTRRWWRLVVVVIGGSVAVLLSISIFFFNASRPQSPFVGQRSAGLRPPRHSRTA
jgi:hypothetical protein